MYKKLLIVSDTAIFTKDGKFFAFGPVVDELNSFKHFFEEIVWIGYERNDRFEDLSMKEVTSSNVKMIFFKSIGGKNFRSFIEVIYYYPIMFFTILRQVFSAQVVHTRAPSHPAFIALIISFFYKKKLWWNKFAGSWQKSTLPFFYKVQRSFLIKAKHSKVTINGYWEDQPKHCISFENPCLNNGDISRGIQVSNQKSFDDSFIFCFVGRLDEQKGVGTIIKSLKEISFDKIKKVHFIGDGKSKEIYINESKFLLNKVEFHGFLNRERVHEIISNSHFILLPSVSEGFPKVIAEASCYGTIPIVSDVGSISHYINEENGFLWRKSKSYSKILNLAIETDSEKLKLISTKFQVLAKKFTFSEYIFKLEKFILND